MTEFVHLNIHSEYSIVDGIIRIDDYLKHAKSLGCTSVAITDKANLFAYTKFFHKAVQYGLHPIIGVDFDFALKQPEKDHNRNCQLILLAMNNNGLRQLFALVTEVWRLKKIFDPLLLKEQVDRLDCSDLICIQQFEEMDIEVQNKLVSDVKEYFDGRHYLSVNRLNSSNNDFIHQTFQLAENYNLPVVPTNKVCFLKREDFDAHEARLCIQHGYMLSQQERIRYSKEQYLKSVSEMTELFSENEILFQNTIELAKRCNVYLDENEFKFPLFPIEASFDSVEDFLAIESNKGLTKRLLKLNNNNLVSVYHERLAVELKVINEMGFAGYFLVVADFIAWAKKNGIPVGPGRGSGAGSLVAYALGIVDLDPIEFDLLFERFLNPERISMPDFDIDFCIEGRDRVIEYVASKYGKENVSQIITFGTMAAKAVIRDVGRVLGLSYGYVDRIAKLIPFEIGITIDKALSDSAELSELYETNEDVQNLIELAKSLEGIVRNAGTHAGGVVIAPKKLITYMPLYFEDEHSLTQLDKYELEKLGLVKFDFLGLKTLTVIRNTLDEIKSKSKVSIDLNTLNLDDPKTFELLTEGDTVAVFQLESVGMRDLVKKIKPNSIEDVISLIALYRPGPLRSGMVDDYVDRKHSQATRVHGYFHESLKHILEPTFGVILYQEQVMQIAQVFSGYSLGGADILRRAMGKKDEEEMEQQKQIFIDGALKLGREKKKAEEIFEIIEKFAGYGFNKSHSAAYGLIAYQTAYLKRHYRSYFMAASMSFEVGNTDKIILLINDCKKRGIKVSSADVNASEYNFTAIDDQSVLYGLGAIKGIGKNIVSHIVEERKANGAYSSIFNFCERLTDIKLTKRTLEALVKSGAMDTLGDRAMLFDAVEMARGHGNNAKLSKDSGQSTLFDVSIEDAVTQAPSLRNVIPWSDRDRLSKEYEALGLYLTGHPFSAYRYFCNKLFIKTISDILIEHSDHHIKDHHIKHRKQKKWIAGMVLDFRKRGSRLTLNLDDGTETIEVMLFEEAAQNYKSLIRKGHVIVIEGSVRFDDYINAVRVSADQIYDIDEIIENNAKRLTITIKSSENITDEINLLRAFLNRQERGTCNIALEYYKGDAKANISLGEEFRIKPNLQLRENLIQHYGSDNFKFHFGSGISDTKFLKSG